MGGRVAVRAADGDGGLVGEHDARHGADTFAVAAAGWNLGRSDQTAALRRLPPAEQPIHGSDDGEAPIAGTWQLPPRCTARGCSSCRPWATIPRRRQRPTGSHLRVKEFKMFRRRILLAAASAAAAPALVRAQAFPARPVRLVVPWAAGGSTDTVCRVIAEQAARTLGQPMIVENRPGGSTAVGIGSVVNAAPDGYTIGQMPLTTLRIGLMEKIAFDPLTDLVPIMAAAVQTLGVVVRADSPFKSFADVRRAAAASPGKLNYGSTGNASGNPLYTDEILRMLQLKVEHIPYNGSAPLHQALLGGQVDFGVDSGSFAPLVQAGKLRLLLTYAPQRLAAFPDAPSLKELGIALEAGGPYGFVAPKGTPAAIVQRLHDALKAAWDTAQVQSRFFVFCETPAYLDGKGYAAALQKMVRQERRLVERAGLLRS